MTLVVIMDPPDNVPIFLSVTLYALLGQQVLDDLNISIAALQGAGGLLLLLVALELLTGTEDAGGHDPTPEQQTSIAMVPLGTPLLTGPGVIVATIVLVSRSVRDAGVL